MNGDVIRVRNIKRAFRASEKTCNEIIAVGFKDDFIIFGSVQQHIYVLEVLYLVYMLLLRKYSVSYIQINLDMDLISVFLKHQRNFSNARCISC